MTDSVSIPKVETLVGALVSRREQRLKAMINQYPRKNPILSDLGDCNRQIVYGVTNWKDKPAPSTDLQARFEVGNVMEREMTRELLDMGFDFVGGQDSVTITGKGGILLATGRIDGFIKWEGERIPVEFKSMHPNIYDQVESIEDFAKKPWLRKYIRQLSMYCFGHNKEYGLFGLTNCLGGRKWFVLYLDLGECELLLQRLEQVASHLKQGTLPDRITYKSDICGKCDYANVCLADIVRSEAEILTDDVLLADLDRREKLKEPASEYRKIDSEVKKRLQGIEKGIAGDFMIIGKPTHKEAYQVEASDGWRVEIKKLEGSLR
jgi:hypothetical protein